MEENAKSQNGGNKTLLAMILRLKKLHVLLYFSFYKLQVNKDIVVCREYILLF